MTNRILDANQHFVGTEPKFKGQLTKSQLITALNWYAQNSDSKNAYNYGSSYMKKNHKVIVSEDLKDGTNTFGFVCRIVSNGAILPEENQQWFDKTVDNLKKKFSTQKKTPALDEPKKYNIQERIHEISSEILGDLEGEMDDYILSGYKEIPDFTDILGERTKSVNARHITEHFRKRRVEFDDILSTEDEQLKEGYSNFSKSQLKKLISFCDCIIIHALDIISEVKKTRKPRKIKAKTPEKLTSKIRVCSEFKELGLKSVNPQSIIGASQLWVYNTKYRKLGCYNAIDASGFSVKGTSIQNFNESKSVQKKIRKPDVLLKEVLSGGKIFLRTAMESINAVEHPLTGRLNEDTILLRVIK